MWLPEAVDLDALLRVRFAGPSVAILDGEQRAQCGHAANEALHKSRQGVAELLTQRRGLGFGLLLVHSHRQRSLQFEQHARMMSLIARMRPDAGLLHQLSLLLVNNDASELLPHGAWHGNTDNPLKWLELYALPLRIRMLLVTSINVGYNCGELQALVAAAPVLQQFPWVLYCSGPDVLPTPAGIFRMGAEVVRSWNKRHGSRSATNPAAAAALLYLRFPAPPGRHRISLDVMLFAPDRVGGMWHRAARECLRLTSTASAEDMIAEARDRENVSSVELQMPGYLIWRFAKQLATEPRPRAALWHSHNLTAISAWLERQEMAHNLTREAPLRIARRGRAPLHC